MRSERLAGRVQAAEVLKAQAMHVSLIASAKGRHPQVFSRAGSESESHFESLLWSLCGPWLEGEQAMAGLQASGSGGWAQVEASERKVD